VKLLEDADSNEAIVPAGTPSGPAPAIRPGGRALVQLFYGRGLPVGVGDRFVIRDVGRRETVAGGVVLDNDPGTVRRADGEALSRLRVREGLTGDELARRIVAERGAVRGDELARLAGVRTAPGYVVDEAYARRLAHEALRLVAAYHDAHPLARGMPLHELGDALGVDGALMDELLPTWSLERDGAAVALADRDSGLPAGHRAVADAALARLRAAGASPPALSDVGLRTDLAKALERSGELIVLGADIGYPADVFMHMQRRVVDLIADGGPATVSQLREVLGTSRKFAVPFLERLDAAGVTRRTGDTRELGPRGRELVQRKENA
jgi:selenocysteine-specific elongation factor